VSPASVADQRVEGGEKLEEDRGGIGFWVGRNGTNRISARVGMLRDFETVTVSEVILRH
jgi:hypothetical protein